jgi:hypothetical protein
MRAVLIVFLGWIALCSSILTAAAEEPQTIFILDATAQMSARFGQQRKIDLVKKTLSAAVSRIEPANMLAVWAFGSNPKKKCEDTGELVPLQSAASAARALDKALSPVQPQAARAPAFDTMQSALKSLGDAKDKSVSVIVIAGTGDDCVGDICGAAGRLHSVYPNTKLTVLGIGMNEQASANFTCAAKAMGGNFLPIKSGTDLDRILRQILNVGQGAAPPKAAPPGVQGGTQEKSTAEIAAATSGPNAAPSSSKEQPAQREPEAKPAPPQPPQPEPNTILSAALSIGMPALDAGITWEIYKVTLTPTGQVRAADTAFWTGGGGQARVKLPEGRYMAHAAYGFASATAEFTVGTEKVEKTISLEAGTIAAEALQAMEAPAAEGAFFILYRRKASATPEELGRSSEAPAVFPVNAGDYALSVVSGLAKVDTPVKVEAGKVSAVRIALNVGTLEIQTFAAEGSPMPILAWHQIYPAGQDSGKGKIPPLRIPASSYRVQLPAGNYRLETMYGNARQETAFAITPGHVTEQHVILNAGEARISLPPGKSDNICAVYEAGSSNKNDPIGRAAGTDISFILKAGLYDVECRGKGAAAPAKPTQIRVVAGETQSAKIEE